MDDRELANINRHIGRRIRLGRLLQKASLEKMAEHMGVSYQQLQKYELGRNRVSVPRLIQIAVFQEVPITFFFEGLPVPLEQQLIGRESSELAVECQHMLSDRTSVQMLQCYSKITDRNVRKALLALVKAKAVSNLNV